MIPRLLLTCVVASLTFTQRVHALVLASAGRSEAVIVVADDATPPEKHAAEELARFLRQVTGADFAVANGGSEGKGRLLVGPGAAKLADPDFSTDGLGSEGIIIRSAGEDLILAGGRPRGTLYAIYTFLEDHVGCRWWSPTAGTIPSRPSLEVGGLDVRYVPPLEYRESFWFSAFDADWAVRNKCNGQRYPLDDARGGKHVIEGFVHTFYGLIPPDRYFNDHPDWFSEMEGKRKHEHAQLCLANEEMREELVKNLKARLRRNPQATMASVSQNDWAGYCECERCRAVDAEEGSPAGSMIRFVNAVAEKTEREFPNVAISTLAYQYTQRAPAHVRPRPNVVVWLCSIACSFNLPIKSHARNKPFRDDLEAWSKICDRLYIWDYTTNFRHYIFPHPNLRVLGPNVRLFVENNAKGVFEQGAYQSPGAEMMELRAWVLAKLLWNPKLDDKKLIDEFLDGYYGLAAPHVRAYLGVLHDTMQARKQPLGCFEQPDRVFMAGATLMEAWTHLKAAETAVSDADKDLRQRIRVAQMPMLYAFLMKWCPRDPTWRKTPETEPWALDVTPREVYDRFLQIASEAGVTQISEQLKLDDLQTRVKLPD